MPMDADDKGLQIGDRDFPGKAGDDQPEVPVNFIGNRHPLHPSKNTHTSTRLAYIPGKQPGQSYHLRAYFACCGGSSSHWRAAAMSRKVRISTPPAEPDASSNMRANPNSKSVEATTAILANGGLCLRHC